MMNGMQPAVARDAARILGGNAATLYAGSGGLVSHQGGFRGAPEIIPKSLRNSMSIPQPSTARRIKAHTSREDTAAWSAVVSITEK